jgi:Uncharacterized protein conserved in bacteria (DUF2330)
LNVAEFTCSRRAGILDTGSTGQDNHAVRSAHQEINLPWRSDAMTRGYQIVLSLAGVLLLTSSHSRPVEACCPAPRSGQPVVNADQTIVIFWDAAARTQHSIRRASFKSEGEDFGFLVPSPSRPELAESGNEAFPVLQKITEPEFVTQTRPSGGSGCGCASKSAAPMAAGLAEPASVRVLEEKVVAGFNAKVLEADTTDVLVQWLKENGYAYSPEVATWAKPYVDGKWKITALKVAKKKDDANSKDVTASALRMSFKTDRPLFPYREPESSRSAASLGADRRLLRIYFLAEARYQGELTKEQQWTGNVAWAGRLNPDDRKKVLDLLHLPEATGPADVWLTEFEDNWPYKVAPADVYFSPAADQSTVRRPPIILYVGSRQAPDVTPFAIGVAMALSLLVARLRPPSGDLPRAKRQAAVNVSASRLTS